MRTRLPTALIVVLLLVGLWIMRTGIVQTDELPTTVPAATRPVLAHTPAPTPAPTPAADPAPPTPSATDPRPQPPQRGTFRLEFPAELVVGEKVEVPVFAEAGEHWLYSFVIAFAWDEEGLELHDVEGAPAYRIAYSGRDLEGGEGAFGFLRLTANDSPDPVGAVHVATLTLEVLTSDRPVVLEGSEHERSWYIACPDGDCMGITDDDARLLDESNRHEARMARHEIRAQRKE